MSSNSQFEMSIDSGRVYEVYKSYLDHIRDEHFDFHPVQIQDELKFANMYRVSQEGCLLCMQRQKHCPYERVNVWRPSQ